MPSPFASFTNATLYVPIPGAPNTIDPETGNVIPATQIEEVRCTLSQKTRGNERSRGIPDDHINDSLLAGYLVEPMSFPIDVTLPIECDIEVNGVTGRAWIPVLVASPYRTQVATGQRIEVYFKVQS